MMALKFFPQTGIDLIVPVLIYAIGVLFVILLGVALYYAFRKNREHAYRNVLLIFLSVSIVAVGIVHIGNAVDDHSDNVFEEIYKDLHRNRHQMLIRVPVFETGIELEFGAYYPRRTIDGEIGSYWYNRRSNHLGEPLGENEIIRMVFYEKPNRLVMTHSWSQNGEGPYYSKYVYDCQSKTLSYETDLAPHEPRDTFLEDRILTDWFRYNAEDSELAYTTWHNEPTAFTQFSMDDWGDVIITY